VIWLVAAAYADEPAPPPVAAPLVPETPAAAPEYSTQVMTGATALGLEPAYVQQIHDGLELLFRRDYKGTRDHFEKMDADWPGTGVGAVADTLVWQALMFENFDFRYDKQYKTASKRARGAIQAALDTPGHEAWEHFEMASIVGIESIHAARQENYLTSLQLAFEAMDHAEAARDGAPGFVDLGLADGLYNYWRTVVTQSSKVLPDFGDHRAEGIAQMQDVEQRAVFVVPLTTLALAFAWMEEDDWEQAAVACRKNHDLYPDSVINNMQLGRVYYGQHKFPEAMRAYDDIIRVAPDNDRVWYYEGLTLARTRQWDKAKAAYQRYLSASWLEDWQKSTALYRLGNVNQSLGLLDDAEQDYKDAIAIDGNAPAKARLEKLRASRKAGAPVTPPGE
jgi:tetratricopeptide (TPR) repeat protein